MENNSIDIRDSFKKVLDCKAETHELAQKSLKTLNSENVKMTLTFQEQCLSLITQIKEDPNPSLVRYRKALSLTENRIRAEKQLITSLISENPTVDVSGFLFDIMLVKENEAWEQVRNKPSNNSGTGSIFFDTPIVVGWIFFILLSLYVLYHKKLNITSQRTRAYFENLQKRIVDFLLKKSNSVKK